MVNLWMRVSPSLLSYAHASLCDLAVYVGGICLVVICFPAIGKDLHIGTSLVICNNFRLISTTCWVLPELWLTILSLPRLTDKGDKGSLRRRSDRTNANGVREPAERLWEDRFTRSCRSKNGERHKTASVGPKYLRSDPERKNRCRRRYLRRSEHGRGQGESAGSN